MLYWNSDNKPEFNEYYYDGGDLVLKLRATTQTSESVVNVNIVEACGR